MTSRRKRSYFDGGFSGDDITTESDCLEQMTGCERDKEDLLEKEVNDIVAGGLNDGSFFDKD